jgi:hypothetical protein
MGKRVATAVVWLFLMGWGAGICSAASGTETLESSTLRIELSTNPYWYRVVEKASGQVLLAETERPPSPRMESERRRCARRAGGASRRAPLAEWCYLEPVRLLAVGNAVAKILREPHVDLVCASPAS